MNDTIVIFWKHGERVVRQVTASSIEWCLEVLKSRNRRAEYSVEKVDDGEYVVTVDPESMQ